VVTKIFTPFERTLVLQLVLFFHKPTDDYEKAAKTRFQRGATESFWKPDLAEEI